MSSSRPLILVCLVALLAACADKGGDGRGGGNKPPVAQVAVSPAGGPAPLKVGVSGAASTDPDGTIAGYSWAFGDGSNVTGVSAEHTYASVGEFVITLTVTDDDGATATATARVVATGSSAVYNASVFDGANYQDEPSSGTWDTTTLQ
jgi:PKD repeat protein